jgi:hypothetical protein
VQKHSKKDAFLVSYLIHGHTNIAIKLYTSLSSTLDQRLIQNKTNVTYEMADKVLLVAKKEPSVWLEAALRFWQSGNLCRLGSPAQHLYISYIVYELMRGCELTELMFEYVRAGMQERIQVHSEDM